ncbi:MAG: hypothetical protein VKM34_11920, partial [Cyanobacteriota bacterium]|nr:hypothetical protein [Cyanobacteriota bacterium]
RAGDLARVAQLRRDSAALVKEAAAQSSKDGFAQLLQRRSIAVNREQLEANSLAVALRDLEASLEASAGRLEDNLAAGRRQGYLRTALDLLKLATTCTIMVLFLRWSAIWSVEATEQRPEAMS